MNTSPSASPPPTSASSASPPCWIQKVVSSCAVSKPNHAAGALASIVAASSAADDEARDERRPPDEPALAQRATARRARSRPSPYSTPAAIDGDAGDRVVGAAHLLEAAREASGTCTNGATSVSSSPVTASRSRMRASPSVSSRSKTKRWSTRPDGRVCCDCSSRRYGAKSTSQSAARARSRERRAPLRGDKRLRRRIAHVGLRHAAREAVGRAVGPEADRSTSSTTPGLNRRTSHQYGA